MITSALLTISVRILLLNRLLSILAAYIGDTKLWSIVLAGLFGLVGIMFGLLINTILRRLYRLEYSLHPENTEVTPRPKTKPKRREKRDDSIPSEPPPSGKRLTIIPLIVGASTAMICVLLFVVFNQMSKRFDSLSQTVHERVKDSQAFYEKQLNTYNSNLDLRFKTLEKSAAYNTKALEGFRNTLEKGLAQINAVVITNAEQTDLLTKKYDDLALFVDDKSYQLALRVANAEGVIGLESPFRSGSPVEVTNLGHKYLKDSGLNDLLAKYDSELTAMAEKRGVSSPEEIERSARYAVNTFEWDIEDFQKVDNYMLSHYDRKMFNIWEIGGIRFRDILMDRYGMQFPTESREKEPTQTD